MKVDIRKSFEKDVTKITEQPLALKLHNLITELEVCASLSSIANVKKMKAAGNFYRIRVGSYRVRLKIEMTR